MTGWSGPQRLISETKSDLAPWSRSCALGPAGVRQRANGSGLAVDLKEIVPQRPSLHEVTMHDVDWSRGNGSRRRLLWRWYANTSPLHCRIGDALEPELRSQMTWQGHSDGGGSMPRPMMFFVPAILFMPLGTVLVTAQTSLAEPAADECKTKPGSSAPSGSHWYYRIDRTDQRRCWFLGPEGAYVRSQARETASNVSSPRRTPPREKAVETARVIPASKELAQRTPLEAASTEAAADFAAPSSDLPKIPDLDAREPTTISNNSTGAREPMDAQEEMPSIWPVLTEAEHAGLQDPARETAPMPVFLVGALAMALLCAGAIFMLARRKTQSYRRGRRVVSSRPRRLHPGQKMRANMSETAARSNDLARRSVAGARQRPSSVDPAHDIKASLRKIMDDLQRVAA